MLPVKFASDLKKSSHNFIQKQKSVKIRGVLEHFLFTQANMVELVFSSAFPKLTFSVPLGLLLR